MRKKQRNQKSTPVTFLLTYPTSHHRRHEKSATTNTVSFRLLLDHESLSWPGYAFRLTQKSSVGTVPRKELKVTLQQLGNTDLPWLSLFPAKWLLSKKTEKAVESQWSQTIPRNTKFSIFTLKSNWNRESSSDKIQISKHLWVQSCIFHLRIPYINFKWAKNKTYPSFHFNSAYTPQHHEPRCWNSTDC